MTKKTKQQEQPLVTTGAALQLLPAERAQYVIDGLLRIGRKRISLLLGRPHDGKSTLAWQLAVAVCKGIEFLGRETLRSEVLYWQTEEDPQDLRETLDALGYDEATDEPLHIFKGGPSDNNVKVLGEELRKLPSVRLVIVETLDDLLKITNVLENTASRKAFDEFDEEVVGEFHNNCAFLCLHHLKKNETDDEGLMVLGASVISARTDARIYIRKTPGEDRRTIFTDLRRGWGIEKTYLDYDESTRSSTLGPTVAEEFSAGLGQTQKRILTDILKFVQRHAGTQKKVCLRTIQGKTDDKERVFRRALADSLLVEAGTGKKGDPFTYRVANVPSEIDTARLPTPITKKYDVERQLGEIA